MLPHFIALILTFSAIAITLEVMVDEKIIEKTKILDTDKILGNKDADLTLIEYSSLTCIDCADFHTNEFVTLKNEFIDTGKIKYIYRHFPLNAMDIHLAYIAESIPNENYYDFIMDIYNNQDKIGSLTNTKSSKEKAEKTAREMTEKYVSNEEMDNILEETTENKAILNRIFTEKFVFEKKYDIKKTPTFYLINSGSLNLKLEADEVIDKLRTLNEDNIIVK